MSFISRESITPRVLVFGAAALRAAAAASLGEAGWHAVVMEDEKSAARHIREHGADAALLACDTAPGACVGLINELERARKAFPVVVGMDASAPAQPGVEPSVEPGVEEVAALFRAGAWDYLPLVREEGALTSASGEALRGAFDHALERSSGLRRSVEMEDRYLNLLHNLPVIVFAIDRSLRPRFFNSPVEEAVGYSARELIDEPELFQRRVFEEDLPALKEVFDGSRGSCEEPLSVDFRFKHRKGYVTYLRISTLPEPEDVCSDQVEGVIMDITERSFLEKMLVEREKTNILASVSAEIAHEMRNPIMALAGFARMLGRKCDATEEIEVIRTELGRLEELVERVSHYVKPVEARPRSASLNAVLGFCSERLATKLARRSLECGHDLGGEEIMIWSDPDALLKAFSNLINSVADALPEQGTIKVSVDESPNHVTLEYDIRPPLRELSDPDLVYLPFVDDELSLSIAFSNRIIKSVGGFMGMSQGPEATRFNVTLPKRATMAQEPGRAVQKERKSARESG